MSSYSVIVRKGEIFVKRWNTEIRDYEEKKKTEQVLSDVLQFPIVLEETNFGQFFAIIAREKELYEKVFKAALYGHPLDPFIKECDLPPKGPQELDFVRVGWHCRVEDGEFEFSPCFNGWADLPGGAIEGSVVQKGSFGIEYMPLNEYKDLLLKLDTESNIWSLEQSEPLAKGTRKFTAYDIIKAILFEITWAGDISKGRKAPWEEDKKSEQAA